MFRRLTPWIIFLAMITVVFSCKLALRDNEAKPPVASVPDDGKNHLKDVQYNATGGGQVVLTFKTEPVYEVESQPTKKIFKFSNCKYLGSTGKTSPGGKWIEVRWAQHENNIVWVVLEFAGEAKVRPGLAGNTLTLSLIGFEARPPNSPPDVVEFSKSPIPAGALQLMKEYSWSPGCPVSPENLRYLQLGYWGYDEKEHQGVMIVHKNIADEVIVVFRRLYEKKFPIEKMNLIDYYKGNDDASMADNNTSAFNCRKVTGGSGYSKHAYGYAVDINPLVNPYIRDGKVMPPLAGPFLDRTLGFKGMIVKGGPCYQTFTELGWKWGGDWHSMKEYRHFEKPS